MEWILAHPELAGPIHLAAPNPLPNRNFLAEFRHQFRMPPGLPAPGFLLEAGAFALRTETELLLKNRRVISNRLMDNGFTFKFDHWSAALADLLAESAASRNNYPPN